MSRRPMSRRLFLGGAASLLALPPLESAFGGAAGAAESPKNFVVWHFPTSWTPTPGALIATGARSGALTAASIGPVLRPLAAADGVAGLLDEAIVVDDVRNEPAYDSVTGDHARGVAGLLTCQRAVRGAVPVVGPSLDHVVAGALDQRRPLRSMQLATTTSRACEAPFPCVYTVNSSWSAPGVPAPGESDPAVVFARMFAGYDPVASETEVARRLRRRRSVLDHALEQTQALRQRLNARDRARLDQYQTQVRELELRLTHRATAKCTPGEPPPPTADARERLRAMSDLTVLALECGITSVVHFAYEHTISEVLHPFLTTADGRPVVDSWHSDLTHHNDDPYKIAQLQAVNTWLVGEFAGLARRLKAIGTLDGGTLLDQTLLLGVSDMGDGAHNHERMRPLLLGGKAIGLRTGRLIRGPNGGANKLSNLYVGILQALGVAADRFGDSDGAIRLV